MIGGAPVCRIHECHCIQIVAAADSRFFAAFHGDQQLTHRSREGIGEPAFLPRRFVKYLIALAGVFHRRGGRVRVLAPADISQRQAVGPFDTPEDSDVAGTALARRAGPCVIQSGAEKPSAYSR